MLGKGRASSPVAPFNNHLVNTQKVKNMSEEDAVLITVVFVVAKVEDNCVVMVH
jgi:hypothetical protein